MRSIAITSLALLLCLGGAPAFGDESHRHGSSSDSAAAAKCEHGVKESLCARCNPKLEPIFKSKGDWCAEHTVPESQCVKCNPELAKQGVK